MDYTKIPKELQDKMQKWEANKPEFKSVKLLEDIGLIAEDISNSLADLIKGNQKTTQDVGIVLLDVRESLEAIKGKKDVEIPDYAKPVVEGLKTLDTSIAKALKGINFKPEFKPEIKVAAPDVKVDVPEVDLRGIEKAMKELPKAFDKAVKSIPKVSIPESDFTPLLESLNGISEQLQSIDTAARMKPQFPNILKVTNSDGSKITSDFSIPPYDTQEIDETDPSNVVITYKMGVTTVATKTISVTGSVTTITVV